MITTVCTEKAPAQKRTGAMQRPPPRRGKLSAKRTDEGRVCRNCPIAGLLLRRGRACPARGLPAEGLAPSARRLRPQAVGERASRKSEIFRVMVRFSPSGPAGPPPSQREARIFQIARKPLPTISLLFTIVIKAWSSRPRTCRRSFWAWPRVRTVVSTHFSSWV